jgi:DNA (cytosine-5-)-methyltransferase|nr:MAG TPA: Cytosine specific methyltransferase [Caudoviricetes sp.]
MLKLATVFSGIGAIEHALERLGIDYKIEFACDNGEVDILSKKIDDSIESVNSEFKFLSKLIDIENEFEDWLSKKLNILVKEYKKLNIEIVSINIDFQVYINLVTKIIEEGKFNKTQTLFYENILENVNNKDNDLSRKYEYIKLMVKLNNDLSKIGDNEVFLTLSQDTLFKLKDIVKKMKAIREELSMLHERINTENIRKKVFSMDSLEEQKSYVDSLYSGKEKQNKVRTSYFANYDIDDSRFHWNVSFLDGRKFKDIDLLVGGSPCQSFSLVGKQRGLGDTRGTLFYEYARLVDEIKPKVFIYENVRAVLSNDSGKTWETMTKIFEDLGYDWYYEILNARDYGIPQNRERVFVVGFRKDLSITKFKYPKIKKLEKTMQDFLLDNVSGKYYLAKKGVDFVISQKNLDKRYTQIDGEIQLCQKKNQQFNWHGDFIFEEECKDKEALMDDLEKYFLSEKVKKYVLSTGTKSFYSKPKIDLEIARPLLTTMHKMHRAGVDNYVTTEGRLRKLTPRECLRLMGFCDSFKIVVSDTSLYQQSGNSIVVDVLMEILKEIYRVYPDLGNE